MPMDLAELLVPWLLSAVEERFESRVSICAEVISPTSNVCCVLKRSSYGWVRSPSRCPGKRAILNAVLPQFPDFVSGVREFAIKCRLRCVSGSCRCNRGGHTHIQGRTASWDSSGGENISRPGLRSGEPSGFRSNTQVRKFHTADQSVNARMVSSRGFGCAAGFCVFQLWVQEGAAAPTLSATHPESVAESFFAHW